MREKTDWEKRYQEDDLHWDTGMPEITLINLIASW
ncbi:MAG: class I SAM-dependent methyltransferase, partial [Candidatus Electrothrix sp. AR1]|nr:class I SAM-dependent methyltransferase [Candidatus Electrothrix sp. AR1]